MKRSRFGGNVSLTNYPYSFNIGNFYFRQAAMISSDVVTQPQ